jgi:peptidoglycan hydrolase-like protein with peptidoglycan-binding domain
MYGKLAKSGVPGGCLQGCTWVLLEYLGRVEVTRRRIGGDGLPLTWRTRGEPTDIIGREEGNETGIRGSEGTVHSMPSVISRSLWQDPMFPVAGPADDTAGGTWVVHYPGSTSPHTPSTDIDFRSHLRSAHESYLRNRGYSYGYSWVIAQFGLTYEVRGWDQRPASNPGKKVSGNFNYKSRTIQIMVGAQDPAFPAAVKAANELIATRPNWDVIIHGDVDYTSCCGVGVIGQVRAGIIGHGAPSIVVEAPLGLSNVGYNPPHDWWWFPLDGNKAELRRGAESNHVRYLQDVIFYYCGGNISVDGRFGPKTQRRVQELQRYFGITSDGVVGTEETWPVMDYIVGLNAPAPAIEVTPEFDVVAVGDIMYYVESGDSPWSVAELAYGDGSKNLRIDTAGFKTFSTPSHPHRIFTPGVPGLRTQVLPGEGPLATLDRIGVDRSRLDTFYAWNGGWDHVFQPGETVYMPLS